MTGQYLRDYYLPDLRLCILRLLMEAEGNSAGASVLHAAGIAMGFREDRDSILRQLRYLAEVGAVELEDLGETVTVATLTQAGEDHVNRLGPPLPGIKRPALR